MQIRGVRLATLAAVFATAAAAQAPQIDRLLEEYVTTGRIAGAVGVVMRHGKVVYQHAAGWSDKEAGRRMTVDTLFRIASQTKPITSTAVMSLVEDGKIGLNEPVSHFIPGFEKTTVVVKGSDAIRTVPGKRPITISDLLTHTAGIPYGREAQLGMTYRAKGLGPAAGHGFYLSDKDEPICAVMERLATLPFMAQPGEAWVYGYNTDILGCVVERASGMPLDRFVETRITGPLGMKETRFFVPPTDRERLAVVYGTGADGKIFRAPEGQFGQGHFVDGPRKCFSGGAGLTATARDYALFLEAMRSGGKLGDVRILGPRSVKLMTTNQVGTMYSTTGTGFGFGFQTVERVGGLFTASPGAFAAGGAYGTAAQVDPEARMVLVLMVQMYPNGTDVQGKFMRMAYQNFDKP